MSKIEKKVNRLKEQIAFTESELTSSLGKKKHNAMEVSVPTLTERLKKLRAELATLQK